MPQKPSKPRVYVADMENPLPIAIVIGGAEFSLSLTTARALLAGFIDSVRAVDAHFRCSHQWPWFGSWRRCQNCGAVRIGDEYYCKVHVRQMAKKAKVQP